MRNTLVYDLPTRIFHWTFSGLFVGAFFIAKTIDDESPIFSYHMLAGLILAFIVLLRLVWGFIGTRYARFSSFALAPSDLFYYMKGIFTGNKRKWPGHNPASSWAALVMLTLALALAVTGVLMTSGHKEEFEDAHELFANAFLVTVLLHIAGVLTHIFRHQDALAMSMIDGKKQCDLDQKPIKTSRPLAAILFLLFLTFSALYVSKNYNPQDNTLELMGNKLSLGESETGKNSP